MSRIGIFGGTFNPPHVAHKRLILEAAKAAELDKVIVVPANIPPHKIAHDLVAPEERLSLCKLTFSESIFEVSDIEIKRQGKSYTVDTLEYLKDIYPEDELYLIIGSDMLLTFQQWAQYEKILSLAKLIVTTRQGDVNNEMLYSHAESVLKLSCEDITVLELEPKVLSSTQIRQIIKSGGSAQGLLTDETLEYINKKGFYR